MPNTNKGLLIVISGASGAGKGSICSAVIARGQNIVPSISVTTRKPRPHEIDGVDYFFVNVDEFNSMVKQNKLLEHAEVYDNMYGTPRDFVESQLNQGNDVVLEIDNQGGLDVKQSNFQCVLIYITPPSIDILEKRLRKRNTEDEQTIQKRLSKVKSELQDYSKYDYVVVNDDLETAIDEVTSIICAEHKRSARNNEIIKKMLGEKE